MDRRDPAGGAADGGPAGGMGHGPGALPRGGKTEAGRDLAAANRWGAAEELLDDVEDIWEDRRWLVTALYDHEIVDDTDAALAQLEIYCDARDALAFRALCRSLAENMEAAGKAHQGTVENFF